MTKDADAAGRLELGRYGVWRSGQYGGGFAAEVEALGYGALWVGGSPAADLAGVEELLDATGALVVATGIVNIWTAGAADVAASYHRIAARHPDRLLLGVGAGHAEHTAAYTRPYAALVDYLDVLDAERVPVGRRALAALGPKVLRLSGDRTAGAHPYLTTPAHTRQARELLGEGALLAPEQKVVVTTDSARARRIGEPTLGFYLGLRNYVSNLRRLGFTDEDFADGGSDRLFDELILHGDAATVAAGVTAHLEAGADHVAIHALGDDPADQLRQLADALHLR